MVMDWNLALQAVQAAAVLFGVAFGVIQVRQFRAQKEHQAAIQLLQSMQDPNMAPSILALYKLPDGLDADELSAKLGSKFDGVLALAAMFDSLGPLVARGHVPLNIFVDFYRGATVVCWRKLRRYVEIERKAGWGNLYEWLNGWPSGWRRLHRNRPTYRRLSASGPGRTVTTTTICARRTCADRQ